MPRPFALPDLGEGLTEAEIVRVLVGEGDVVQEDAPLLEVETDKAQVEIPSPMSGRVERVHVRPNQTVRVGEVLVTFADAETGARTSGPAAPGPGPVSPPPAPTVAAPIAATTAPVAATATPAGIAAPTGLSTDGPAARTGPVPAAPATRRLARELGVDLRGVRGTGPGGRVSDDDVRAAGSRATAGAVTAGGQVTAGAVTAGGEVTAGAAPSRGEVGAGAAVTGAGAPARPAAPPASAEEPGAATGRASRPVPLARGPVELPPLPRFEQWGPVERQPLSHLRRTIAERMSLAAAVIPHVAHLDRADITELDLLIRRNLDAAREQGVTLTLTGFLLRAVALALRAHPVFNASLDAAAGELILKRYCHLGVAVATDRGLIVPVIRDVDRKPVLELARELGALAARVREGKATLDDLRGGTFTVTNLGSLGGTGALPIINYPEVAILGVARAREEPVVRDGQIVPRLLLPLTLTFDHRVADGADGARFAADIIRRLERPDHLLLGL
jgi:pyruvate dehydrogenase E2 component (dihydrolipoamide acetyltransferase)